VQTHGVEKTNLRVIALLLMLGEQTILDHLIQTLDDYPQHRKQLTNLFLLLGTETQEALLEIFHDASTSAELRAEIAAVLGMMSAPEVIAEYAQNIGSYGISATRTSALFPDQLAIALRSLGGLLAAGHWNMRKLQELRDTSLEGSPARELFSVLLGWRYTPQLARLESELERAREEYKKQMVLLSSQMATAQKRSQSLEDELEDLRREHGEKSDQLHQLSRDKDILRGNLDQMAKEKSQLIQERDAALASLAQIRKEKDAIDTQLQKAHEENRELFKKNQELVWQANHPKTP
jgi:hypothetical protein